MKIESPAFQNNQNIPAKYTCDGENISPPLKISGVPENAKSLALIVDDPDAPMCTWIHWVLLNISPATSEIAENSAPAGALELKTSFGKPSSLDFTADRDKIKAWNKKLDQKMCFCSF